ncbi:VWA domain-containing protein [Pengzhenrongella sicca]|uniref:VWA domain-containing protein n=1 Tax=Pengzhenrongella sicca TaxID=2819238 RepID=A0A8A4ZAS2_9MICO|nr:VWA domain-containing protein [Pengzhenrongella sicca]QTE28119.1 VWA domain-containing protein [Pengzhenrongella sicca]
MTLRMIWPLWALMATLGPVLVLAVVQAVRSGRSGAAGRAGPADGATRLAWIRRAALVAVVAVIGLCPATATSQEDAAGVDVEMFFVVDRTGSMAAEDWGTGVADADADVAAATAGDGELAAGGTRLDGARADVVSLVADVPGARYSVLTFDSQASRQLPLTSDARAVGTWAQTVRQEITAYSQGSLTDRPLAALRSALAGAADRNPSHVRLVFFLSDGEQTADGEPASYADLAPLVDGGAVLGYGTEAGGRMRSYDGAFVLDPDAPYIQDGESDALSRLDEATLQATADQLGVAYVHRTGPAETASIVAGVDPDQLAADGRRDVTTYSDLTWPFAALAVVLLAGEAWGAATRRGRARGPRTRRSAP